MDRVWAEGSTSLKTPGAFQHRFSYFSSSYRTGTPLLGEPRKRVKIFLAFQNFPRDFPSLRNISAPDQSWKNAPLFAISILPAAP
jgi:YD repeat-containing protein